MRELNISIGVISQDGGYLLQLRGNDPKIGAAGKIGAFGGKIEEGETALQAVCREIAEETSLVPDVARIRHIASYAIESDHKLETVNVNVEAFEISIDKEEQVSAIDGEVVQISNDKIADMLDLMTPATRHYFEMELGE